MSVDVDDFIGFTTTQDAHDVWRFARRRYWTAQDVEDGDVKAAELRKIGPREREELKFLVAAHNKEAAQEKNNAS